MTRGEAPSPASGERAATRSGFVAKSAPEPAQEVHALVEFVVARLVGLRWDGSEASLLLPAPTGDEVATLTHHAIRQDLKAAIAMAEGLRSEGRSTSWLAQRLVAGVAKHLGDGWQQDDYTFTEVTVGAGTLQRLVRHLEAVVVGTSFRGVVLLTSSQTEQHSLGLFVVAQALREDDWAVLVQPRMGVAHLCDLLESEEADAVGLSLSDPERAHEIEDYVEALRTHPRAPHILLGGPAVLAPTARRLGIHHCAEPEAARMTLRRLV